jgi:hypothetical protein
MNIGCSVTEPMGAKSRGISRNRNSRPGTASAQRWTSILARWSVKTACISTVSTLTPLMAIRATQRFAQTGLGVSAGPPKPGSPCFCVRQYGPAEIAAIPRQLLCERDTIGNGRGKNHRPGGASRRKRVKLIRCELSGPPRPGLIPSHAASPQFIQDTQRSVEFPLRAHARKAYHSLALGHCLNSGQTGSDHTA